MSPELVISHMVHYDTELNFLIKNGNNYLHLQSEWWHIVGYTLPMLSGYFLP